MALTTYTSYASIRAALQASERELPDATLASTIYVNSLEIALFTLDADLLTHFTTASGESTTAALNLVKAVDLFAAYYVAQMCSPVLLTKSVTDGKAGFIRQSDKAYLDVMARLDREFSKALANLEAMYDTYADASTSSASPPVYLAVSNLATDPVTGS